MGLPQQIQKQADAVEHFDKMVAQAQTPAPADPQDSSEPERPVEEAKKPEVPEPEASAPQEEDQSYWKHKFQTLQGLFNSQMPVLQAQVKQLTEQLADANAKHETADQKPDEQARSLVTKTDVEAFGEDLIDVIRRGAREEITRQAAVYEEKIAALTAELQTAKKDVGNVVQSHVQSQQDQFYAGLSASIPKWQEIQATKECQEFLGSLVPGTRTEWNTVLLDAANAFDIPRVLQVFEQFFARHPKYSAKPKQPAQPNRSELERQVAPSKTGSASSSQSSRRVYTGGEYQAESMRLIRLAQQGKHDEAARLESELNAAIAENRVR